MFDNKVLYLLVSFILVGSIFQFYLFNLFDSYFSIIFLLLFLLVPNIINKRIYKIKFIFFIILLILLSIVSLIWSVDIKTGLKNILWYFLFIVLFSATLKVTLRYHKYLLISVNLYFLFLLILSALIIVFRLNPNLEMNFLNSKISKIFINPNLIFQYFNDYLTNISDVNKAGGFFVNANVAATYLGINYFILVGFYLAYKKFFYLIIMSVIFLGILFTGSKAAIILLIGLNLVFLLINERKFLRKKRVVLYLLTVIIFPLFIMLIVKAKNYCDNFINAVSNTLTVRLLIWKFGAINFLNHPILGLGFGGWIQRFETYANQFFIQTFPPHNILIALWANSGILAVLIGVAIMYSILRYGIALLHSDFKELKGLGVSVLFGFSWVFLQGMGENFGLFGDEHIKVILSFLLGYSYARYIKYKGLINGKKVNNNSP